MKNGFTLIELMVSVALFAVVMVVALGSLLSISAADRKAETLKTVMTNLNFALESMSRNVRTGSYYDCGPTLGAGGVALDANGNPPPTDCSASGDTSIAFRANDGTVTVYRFNATCAPNNTGCIERSTTGGSTGSFVPLTAPEIILTGLTFYVSGSLPCNPNASGVCIPDGTHDAMQPKVLLTLNGRISIGSINTASSTFNVQTSITQRIYDQ